MNLSLYSFSVRVALLKKSGEQDWRNRINRKQDVAKFAAGDQHAQPLEVELSIKTKVTSWSDDESTTFILIVYFW